MNEFIKLYAPPSYLTEEGELANNDSKLLEYITSNNNKGLNFLRSNRGWKIADICMSYLYGDDNSKIPDGISKVTFKKLRRQIREMIANATNIRPRFEIQTFKDNYQDEADIYSKLNKHWWINKFVDKKVKSVGQWAGGAGTGYILQWPEYNCITGETEISVYVLSHKDVFPWHVSGDNVDLDKLYGVSVRLEMSVPEAHEKYPEHVSLIKQDRSVPSRVQAGAKKVYRALQGVYQALGKNKGTRTQVENPYPTCDIFMTWIRDNSINTTGHTVVLGGDSSEAIFNKKWAYEVPSYYNEDGTRSQYSRRDCKLFPNRRLVISTNYGIIYDGPPEYVNRQVPITDFRFDEIVGEFLGLPAGNDARGLEEAANEMARASVDAVTGRVQPPTAIDDSIPAPLAKKLAANPRTLQGKVFRYNTQKLSAAIKPLFTPDYYTIDPHAIELIGLFQQMSDYVVGTHDLTALTQLAQMPGADTQDAMIRMLGALALDYSRSFEYSLGRMGRIWLDFAPQVYDIKQRLLFLGKDGVTLESWDFEPESLIPKTELNSDLPMWQRLRDHLSKFSLYIAPFSLQERASTTNKLIVLQLKKVGMTFIPDSFVYSTFYDDNKFEELSKQYWDEQETKIKMAARLNAEMQKAQEQASAGNQLFEELKSTIQQGQVGRPSENTAAPKLESKLDDSGVPRTTMTSA